MKASPLKTSPAPTPDRDAIAAYLQLVLGYTSGFVPVRLLPEKGTPDNKPWSEFPPADDKLASVLLRHAERAVENARGLFLVPGTVASPGSARAADIVEMAVILVDLDNGDIAAKRNHLARCIGKPSLEIASGGKTAEGQDKLHLYWRLTEPASGPDLQRVAGLRAMIADKAGGDPAFGSLHQPIRVAGSIHGKYGIAARVRILAQRDKEFDLAEFEAGVQEMPDFEAVGQRIPRAPIAALPTSTVSARDLMRTKVHEGGIDDLTRFAALSKVMGHWIRQARLGTMSIAEAWRAVVDHNAACISPPWLDDRLQREFQALVNRDLLNHGSNHVMSNFEISGQVGARPPALSEDALAAAFVDAHGSDWRHVAAWGTWLFWTGVFWQPDETGQIKETIRQICRAATVGHDKPHEARRIASHKTMAAVERIAACDPAISASVGDWDRDQMLLNTPTGVVDLATGEMRSHDPGQMMTRVTGASVGAECPRWIQFLTEITDGDVEFVGYLQRLCGYCLTGSMSEQIFAFLYGQGANGKSVFLQVLTAVLGSYATTAPLETFMAAHGDRHSTDLAGLRGARMVAVPETETGRAWAESRIKTITGGDPIKARFMHRDFFEFRPTFKLIIAGNHRPHLTGVGEAMRRRLHLVPFSVTIPSERRDKSLIDLLLAEIDGILGWMLQGCVEWQRIGLAPPQVVLEAAQEYFDDEDSVGQWIAEQCDSGPTHSARSSDLFASWSQFAEINGIAKGSQKSLAEALRQRGYERMHTAKARGWRGISLRGPSEAAP